MVGIIILAKLNIGLYGTTSRVNVWQDSIGCNTFTQNLHQKKTNFGLNFRDFSINLVAITRKVV